MMRRGFLGFCSALALVVTGCHSGGPTAVVDRPPNGTSKVVPAETIELPPAPPIYAKGLTLQQGREAIKIGVPLSEVESQIVGANGEPVLWSYSDLLDNPKIAEAIGEGLSSIDTARAMEAGGERAVAFLSRLRLLNLALSDLTEAGVIAPQIHRPWSGDEFRFQIWHREIGIRAGLEAYPEISSAYVEWIRTVAKAVRPQKY